MGDPYVDISVRVLGGPDMLAEFRSKFGDGVTVEETATGLRLQIPHPGAKQLVQEMRRSLLPAWLGRLARSSRLAAVDSWLTLAVKAGVAGATIASAVTY